MPHDCEKAETIDNISKTLERIEESQREQTELIRAVADQNARVSSLEREMKETKAFALEMNARLREAEVYLGKDGDGIKHEVSDALKEFTQTMERINTLVGVLTSKVGMRVVATVVIFVIGMITLGTVCDLLYHKSFFMPILMWVWEKTFGG